MEHFGWNKFPFWREVKTKGKYEIEIERQQLTIVLSLLNNCLVGNRATSATQTSLWQCFPGDLQWRHRATELLLAQLTDVVHPVNFRKLKRPVVARLTQPLPDNHQQHHCSSSSTALQIAIYKAGFWSEEWPSQNKKMKNAPKSLKTAKIVFGFGQQYSRRMMLSLSVCGKFSYYCLLAHQVDLWLILWPDADKHFLIDHPSVGKRGTG